MKSLTKSEIAQKFFKLSYKKQTSILYTAIDYMQQFNGRTKTECIALAMGYESGYDENDQLIYVKTNGE